MDRFMRIAVLAIVAGTAATCWLAVSIIFSGNFHYLTEHSTDERLAGTMNRLNSDVGLHFGDGSQNLGYFLVGRQVENRIVLPEDWDGEFEPVELPAELAHLPRDFLALAHLATCWRTESIVDYVEEEISMITNFYAFDGRLVAQVSADSNSCGTIQRATMPTGSPPDP